jgi:hypothetical protein
MHGIVNLIALYCVYNIKTQAIMKKYFERFAVEGGVD